MRFGTPKYLNLYAPTAIDVKLLWVFALAMVVGRILKRIKSLSSVVHVRIDFIIYKYINNKNSSILKITLTGLVQ
jgi:hypothetical protein